MSIEFIEGDLVVAPCDKNGTVQLGRIRRIQWGVAYVTDSRGRCFVELVRNLLKVEQQPNLQVIALSDVVEWFDLGSGL